MSGGLRTLLCRRFRSEPVGSMVALFAEQPGKPEEAQDRYYVYQKPPARMVGIMQTPYRKRNTGNHCDKRISSGEISQVRAYRHAYNEIVNEPQHAGYDYVE